MLDNPKILLILSDSSTANIIKESLARGAGFFVQYAHDAEVALELFKDNNFDVVICEFKALEHDNNKRIIQQFKKVDKDCLVIGLIDKASDTVSGELVRSGVYDVISKPINFERLAFLTKKAMEVRVLVASHKRLSQSMQEQNIALRKQNTLLSKRVEESTKNLARLYENLRTTYMHTIKALAQAIEARDHYTHSHSESVAEFAVIISEEMGLSVQDIELIKEACELHDLGKIGIQDSILNKPSELTLEERELIKMHPLTGAKILEPLNFLYGVIDLIRQHHENFDGSGYPDGLKGEDILLGARIIRLADTYDAMRSARSYRKVPLSKEAAVNEIKKYSGTDFDPKVVEAFLKVVDRLEEKISTMTKQEG